MLLVSWNRSSSNKYFLKVILTWDLQFLKKAIQDVLTWLSTQLHLCIVMSALLYDSELEYICLEPLRRFVHLKHFCIVMIIHLIICQFCLEYWNVERSYMDVAICIDSYSRKAPCEVGYVYWLICMEYVCYTTSKFSFQNLILICYTKVFMCYNLTQLEVTED